MGGGQQRAPSPRSSTPVEEPSPGFSGTPAPTQGSGPGAPLGVLLASLDLSDGVHQRHVDLIGRAELRPPDVQGAAFEGYRSMPQAVLRAREVSHTSVVLQNAASRFLVVETDVNPQTSHSPDGSPWHVREHMISSTAANPVRVVRALEEGCSDFDATQRRANEQWGQARRDGLTTSYNAAESTYEDEVRAIGGRDLQVGHRRTSTIDGSQSTTPGEVIVDTQPTNDDTALARSGVAGAIPRDRTSRDPAVQAPTFNRSGLNRPQNAVEQTLIHEGTHVAHAQRTLELRHQWQATRGSIGFEAWLRQESRAGRISTEDATVAVQSLSGESSGTEIMARVEAFTSSFHRHAPDDPSAFGQLATLPGYWVSAGGAPDSDIEPVRQRALARLQSYYSSLDQPHRDAFDRFVASPANFPGAAGERPEFAEAGRARLLPALQAIRSQARR